MKSRLKKIPKGAINMVIDVNRLYALKELIIRNGGPLPIGLSTLYAAVQ